ncbi:VanZ family protein [Acidobacteriota bacterium]
MNYIWLFIIGIAYIHFTLKLWESPEEAIHFLEYGLLGFFIFNALKLKIEDNTIYFTAFLIGCLIGIFDEILQWIVKERFWDFRDVGLNALSSGLLQAAIWLGIKPKSISKKIQPRSLRTVSIYLAVNILLLGLCFSNTPKRVQSYTNALPFLSFLQQEEAMNQFNLKHKDSEIGTFYSRLTIDELLSIDKTNAKNYGQILHDWEDKNYTDFLRAHPGVWVPMLYEIRVHIFRRNRRYEKALQTEDENQKRQNLFIAFKENEILEKYFGHTMKESPYVWSEETKALVKGQIDKNVLYNSPVSASFFSPRSEKQMWIVILFILTFLFVVNRFLK